MERDLGESQRSCDRCCLRHFFRHHLFDIRFLEYVVLCTVSVHRLHCWQNERFTARIYFSMERDWKLAVATVASIQMNPAIRFLRKKEPLHSAHFCGERISQVFFVHESSILNISI